MKAPAFWNRPQAGPLAQMLRPLGLAYGAIAARLMERPGAHLVAPVVTVGNFGVGGGGKTPAAIAIARILAAQGETPAFLSRGYGGALSARGEVARVRGQDAREVGDEPLLLARVAPTFVGVNRGATGSLAVEDAGASVLILDDGLQSRRVEPDAALAIVDGDVGVGNGLCLPAGPLRAPLARQLKHVNAVVIVGPGEPGARVAAAARAADVKVLTARLAPSKQAQALGGRKVVAFAGIARPEKFFTTLRSLCAEIIESHAFADHYAYSAREIEDLRARALARGAVLVTTEKDSVRIPALAEPKPAPYAVPVRMIFDDEAALAMLLSARITQVRPLGARAAARAAGGQPG